MQDRPNALQFLKLLLVELFLLGLFREVGQPGHVVEEPELLCKDADFLSKVLGF